MYFLENILHIITKLNIPLVNILLHITILSPVKTRALRPDLSSLTLRVARSSANYAIDGVAPRPAGAFNARLIERT